MTSRMKIAGARVLDAKAPLQVKITKTDIKTGATKEPNTCAAARALCRQTGCEAARVHLACVYVQKNGVWTRYVTPPALRSEIIAFDRGGEFVPGEYTLAPVQPSIRYGNPERKKYSAEYRKRKAAKAKRPQNGKRSKPHVVSSVRTRMPRRGEKT